MKPRAASRSASRKPPETDADMADVIPPHVPKKKPISVRLKLHKPRGKHAAKAVAMSDAAPEPPVMSKIAHILGPDVMTNLQATPMRQPAVSKIPEAPPQGNRAMHVMKVNLKGPTSLYAALTKKSAKVNLKKHLDASFQEIDKQAQRKRRVPNVKILHDLRMPIAVA